MISRRRVVIALGASAFAPLVAFAQQPAKVRRIGFLGSESAAEYASNVDALRGGLRDFGYIAIADLARKHRLPSIG